MLGFLARLRRGKDDGLEATVARLIADDQVCQVLRLVLENPGISGEKLAARSGISPDSIRRCLDSLAGAGLIEKALDSEAEYFVAERAKAAVIRYLPLNYQCPGLLR